MTDFFETLEERLINYNSNISKKISDYSEKLLILNEIETTKPIFNLFKTFFGKNKTLTELKKDLEKNIEKLDKKIIIFIDDLDRLDNSEINEVLKLIRNTADFKNTFFIVAYDRNYVINSISRLNSYSKEGFLEKIFQLEINLPYYDKEELCKKLYQNLLIFFPDKSEILHKNIINKKNDDNINIIYQNLNSMRDVILLSNSLILNYENLKGNVDFKELLYLEILRIKYPNTYEILKAKNNEFIYIDNFKKGLYELRSSEGIPLLFDILKKRGHELGINHLDIAKIKEIINELFDIRRSNFLSIVNVSKYENYFSYRLLEKTLDENAFQKIIQKDLVTVKKQISIWIKKGFEFDLIRRFSSINTYKNKADYQDKIKLIFYIANHESNKSENIIGFDTTIIEYRFGYYKVFKEMAYSFEEHKQFIKDLLLNADVPFLFEANLIRELSSKHLDTSSYKFPLKKEELSEISEKYLDNYIRNSIVDKNLLHLLSANSTLKNYPNNKFEFSKNIRDKVQYYFSTQELNSLIKICINTTSNNTYNITPEILGIFDSLQLMKNYFNELLVENDSDLLREFIKFLDNIKSENTFVRYEFDKIEL